MIKTSTIADKVKKYSSKIPNTNYSENNKPNCLRVIFTLIIYLSVLKMANKLIAEGNSGEFICLVGFAIGFRQMKEKQQGEQKRAANRLKNRKDALFTLKIRITKYEY